MDQARAALKATLVGGAGMAHPGVLSASMLSSADDGAAPARLDLDLDATIGLDAAGAASLLGQAPPSAAPGATLRTTVLPRRKAGAEVLPQADALRPRFDRVRLLGEGAMGEVELARDNDIRRTVAVKRLRSDAESDAALLRFADEVRIVGQLEHPSIVPIYDVGRDEAGKVYLVMKHLQGETMEQLIERLRQGDAATLERFPFTQRVQVFLGILDAMRYAHARGIIHRDLKPANIMVGHFGEVTVLDWGIAKPITAGGAPPASAVASTVNESHDGRLLETHAGSLAGTPLYMSPEQAAGHNEALDARSDVYALVVVLYEWLTLTHPLAGKTTVTEVLAHIIARDYTLPELRDPALAAGVPMEYVFVFLRGLRRGVDQRYQSVAELERDLQDNLAGRARAQCHVTLTKKLLHGIERWIDRNVIPFSLMLMAFAALLVAGLGFGVWRLVVR